MTTIKKINAKQTKIKLADGSRFKAKGDGGVYCEGCAFNKNTVGCPRNDGMSVICTPETREDKRSIIWVERKPKPPKENPDDQL